ncbi:MAG: BACON domain-containing protein [Parabacteroides sp.]|nr:BACON domain-containing protein [Parabacteroides sp.]
MKKAIRSFTFSGTREGVKMACSSLFCLLLLLPGCKTDEQPYMELSVSKLDFTRTAGEQTVDIKSNVTWQSGITPASTASWLTVSPGNGTGNSTVTVSVKANDSYDDRTASITFQSAGGVQTLQVTQRQTDALRLTEEDNKCYLATGRHTAGNPPEKRSLYHRHFDRCTIVDSPVNNQGARFGTTRVRYRRKYDRCTAVRRNIPAGKNLRLRFGYTRTHRYD